MVSLPALAMPEAVNAVSSAQRVARVVDRLVGAPATRRAAEGRQRVGEHPGEYVGVLFVRHGLELTGVEPHPTAVGTGLDLDTVILTAAEIVAVLGAFHVVALALGFDGGCLGLLPVFPEQLRILAGEVLVFVSAGLIRLHG